MGNKILILIFAFFCACQNPVSNVETDRPIETSTFNFIIYQEYGKCDSNGCSGVSLVLLIGNGDSESCYSENFQTSVDSVWEGEKWLYNEGIFISYEINGEYIFNALIETTGEEFKMFKNDLRQLNLNSNTNYNIQIQ